MNRPRQLYTPDNGYISLYRQTVKVVAVLTRDTITVVSHPDCGFSEGQPFQISLETVPLELRKPNADFVVCFDPITRDYSVLRNGVLGTVSVLPRAETDKESPCEF